MDAQGIFAVLLLDPSVRCCRQGFLQFAQRDGFIFIKPPSRLRACETTDFVRDGLEARTEGFAKLKNFLHFSVLKIPSPTTYVVPSLQTWRGFSVLIEFKAICK